LICAGDTSRLSVNGASNYIWQPDSIPGDSIDVIPTATTLYTVIGDVSGCLGSDTITVKVFPNPDIQITADIFEGCEDLPVHFTDLSNFPAVSWYWDFGDHMYSYYQNPGHIYPNPGVFDVSLTMASLYGCTSTYTWPDMINVYKQPHAYFTPIPAYVEELNPTVWFCDQSISATAWNWYFGDPVHQYNYSNLQNPNHTYSDTGSYTVTLAAISEHQCTDTFRYEINVTPSVAFYIPNSFSPNGDGKNETFQGKGIGINPDKFEMYVFTRWGEKIYASHDLNEAWDGRVRGKGKTSEEGIYTWMVIFTDILGKDHKITGYVALIR
jgi:gliding motility-associated-like protein